MKSKLCYILLEYIHFITALNKLHLRIPANLGSHVSYLYSKQKNDSLI